MKTNKIFLIVLFILICGFKSPTNTVIYNYAINGNLKLNKSTPFLGMEFEFKTCRVYLKGGEFRESRLFTGDNNDFIYYKVKNGVWYWKYKNGWRLFFNSTNTRVGDLFMVNKRLKVSFIKKIILRDNTFYKLSVSTENPRFAHKSYYYFDQSKGIVMIKLPSGGVLLRTDCFADPLSETEIDSL